MKNCRVCGIQMKSTPLDISGNVAKMLIKAEEAVLKYHPDLIVFPETVTTSFSPGIPFSEFLPLLETVPGKTTDRFCRFCLEHHVDMVIPTYERSDNQIFNDAVYIDRTGKITAVYRKTHLFPTERLENNGWSTPGNEIVTVDTSFGRVGLIICYDGDFPELSRILALRGASIIVRPSALLRSFEIWELTNRARAYDNHVHMISVNAYGPDGAGNCYFGHSMIVSPNAHVTALARCCEETIFSELDLENDPVSYGVDTMRIFDHLKDRNLKSYTSELLK